MYYTYVCLGVSGVPDVQFAEWQECDLTRQIHLIKLHENLGAHFVRLHDVIKQPKQTTVHAIQFWPNSSNLSKPGTQTL